jgi:hypothetical protein
MRLDATFIPFGAIGKCAPRVAPGSQNFAACASSTPFHVIQNGVVKHTRRTTNRSCTPFLGA